MFKKVTIHIIAIALTGWMGVANAGLIFDFSWDSIEGKVIGVIELPDDITVNKQATKFTITSVDGDLLGYDFVDSTLNVIDNNLFTVLDGEITEFQFFSISNNALLAVNFSSYDNEAILNVRLSQYISAVAPVVVSRVSVPEPSTVILLSLGLAGLSFARYRRQS